MKPNSVDTDQDRRIQPRAFFSADEQLTATALLETGENKALPGERVQVLNISQTGIGLAIPRSHAPNLSKGSRLILNRVSHQGASGTVLDCPLTVKIVWLLDHEYLDNLALGCSIVDGEMDALFAFINQAFPGRIF